MRMPGAGEFPPPPAAPTPFQGKSNRRGIFAYTKFASGLAVNVLERGALRQLFKKSVDAVQAFVDLVHAGGEA
jgi:hypothetical protein